MLLPLPGGPTVVADWIRKQCGQNSTSLQRYAGPEWEEERVYRARLLEFGQRRFHEDLSRFELGVRVLEGRGGFADRTRRAVLLRSLAYEEMLRHGETRHADSFPWNSCQNSRGTLNGSPPNSLRQTKVIGRAPSGSLLSTSL